MKNGGEDLTARNQGVWETQNAIRAPIASNCARNEWEPIPISQLGPAAPPDWIWSGNIARGHTTLFTALWKSGKTTLIGHLLRDLAVGGGLVRDAGAITTLIITEESTGLWCRRRDTLGLTDRVHILSRPFMAKPSTSKWQAFIEQVQQLVVARGYGLVIFDTLASLWPVLNENDAGEVGTALMPVNVLTEAGAGVLLVHHPRKSGGDEAQASRGSGALPGFVDVIVEMRRNSKDDLHDRRRILVVHSRLNEEALESVLELTDEGYVVLGEKAEVSKDDRLDIIAGCLPSEGAGWTVDEVVEKWPTKPPPARRTVQLALADGAKAGRWYQFGTGTRGDAYRYSLAVFDSRKALSLGARIESAATAAPVPPAPLGGTTDEGGRP